MSATDVFGIKTPFKTYRVEIQILDKLVGGIPKDPDTIKKWLTAQLEMGDRVLIELAQETYQELSQGVPTSQSEVDVDPVTVQPSINEMLDSIMAAQSNGNTFKRNPATGNLAYEGRCMKAALKEAANIAFPGTKFPGKPDNIRKGLKNYLAETVFVPETYIDLGVSEPTATEQRIKHIRLPNGRPASTINIVDYIERPKLTFTVRDLTPLRNAVWFSIWAVLEDIGLGADRARSDGRFELLAFERVPG